MNAAVWCAIGMALGCLATIAVVGLLIASGVDGDAEVWRNFTAGPPVEHHVVVRPPLYDVDAEDQSA